MSSQPNFLSNEHKHQVCNLGNAPFDRTRVAFLLQLFRGAVNWASWCPLSSSHRHALHFTSDRRAPASQNSLTADGPNLLCRKKTPLNDNIQARHSKRTIRPSKVNFQMPPCIESTSHAGVIRDPCICLWPYKPKMIQAHPFRMPPQNNNAQAPIGGRIRGNRKRRKGLDELQQTYVGQRAVPTITRRRLLRFRESQFL